MPRRAADHCLYFFNALDDAYLTIPSVMESDLFWRKFAMAWRQGIIFDLDKEVYASTPSNNIRKTFA